MSAVTIRTGARALLLGVTACGPVGDGSADAGSAPPGGYDPPAIQIDGRFEDWQSPPKDASAAPVEVAADATTPVGLDLAADGAAVYLRLALNRPANMQGLERTLILAIDTDGDPATGGTVGPLDGAELAIHFSPASAAAPGAPGEGAAAVRIDERGSTRLDPHSVGLMFEPRTTTSQIEVRISRGHTPEDGSPSFEGTRFRAVAGVLGADDAIMQATAVAEAPLPEPLSVIPTGDPSRAPDSDLRVVVWNVAGSRIRERPAAFARVINLLDPDLLLLDEVLPESADRALLPLFEELERLEAARAGTAPHAAWGVHAGVSGGRQRQVIAVRGGAVRAIDGLARIPYPDSALAVLAQGSGVRVAEVTALAHSGGIPVTAALVDLDGRRILAASLDLVCCGNRPTAVEDRIRRVEAAEIAAALQRAREQGADAVIVGGDFNLVGSAVPLVTMRTGTDVDGTDLAIVEALQLDGASSATWDFGSGPFSPGQLDYALYSDATLEVRRAFVLELRDVAPPLLAAAGLGRGDQRELSDHRPIVVDLAWR